MKKYLFLSLFCLGCSTVTQSVDLKSRKIAQIQISNNLLAESVKLKEHLASSTFSFETCSATLNELLPAVLALEPDHFNRSHWKDEGREIVDNLFQARVIMRQKLKEFFDSGKLRRGDTDSENCVNAVRDGLRVARFIEDYVGLEATFPKPVEKKNTSHQEGLFIVKDKSAKRPDGCVRANPELSFGWELCSGDLLLSRGDALVSAAIARIASHDSQFSHLTLVYVDERTKEPFTVEAHIENGTKLAKFESWATDGKLRAVQFRHKDARMAHRAAKSMFERVRTSPRIKYDFAMNMDDDGKKLFCSEIISVAYKTEGFRNMLSIPLFPSRVEVTNRTYIDGLGLSSDELFAPNDVEVDPRFDMIAEWRDLSRMQRVWMMDQTLTAVFDWMERLNYKFFPTARLRLMSLATTWGVKNLINAVKPEMVPMDINRSTAKTQSTMIAVDTIVFERLTQAVDFYQKKNGVFPTPAVMQGLLEKIRIDDQIIYNNISNKMAFHHFLRSTE